MLLLLSQKKFQLFSKKLLTFLSRFDYCTANSAFWSGSCNSFECMLYYWQKERWTTFSVRCASSRKNLLWPHLWPSTDLDCVDAVCWVALESTDFRYKSTKNHPKALIIQGFYGSGRRGRKFESCHLDQNRLWEQSQGPFSLPSAPHFLRADDCFPSALCFVYAVFIFAFSAAISAFFSAIILASASSHSSLVWAYTLNFFRLPSASLG